MFDTEREVNENSLCIGEVPSIDLTNRWFLAPCTPSLTTQESFFIPTSTLWKLEHVLAYHSRQCRHVIGDTFTHGS